MGVDFYFLKTYVPEQAKHPNRLMNKLEKANILFHELDHDIEGVTRLSAKFKCYDFLKTFAARGLKFEDYRCISQSYDENGAQFEFVLDALGDKYQPKDVLRIRDKETKFSMASKSYVWAKAVFYDRLSYGGKEGYMAFFRRLVGDKVEMSVKDFANILPAVCEEYPELGRKWKNAFKEHAGNFDFVYISY